MTNEPLTSEADLIALMAPLTTGAPGAFGLRDDCAMLRPRPGYDLVLKTDPVRAGVHFFFDDAPEDIAWKALAVNVSDLAAKGAMPLAYLLAMSFPDAPTRTWATRFADGLRLAQDAFGCHLLGGDTDRAPGPLSLTVTVLGEVPEGKMVRRDTARAGDAIYVSGTLGDSGLGLRLHREARDGKRDLRDRWGIGAQATAELIGRYLRPQPRLELSAVIRQHASASMDISDGLVKDLERMCKASGVGAAVDANRIPLSQAGARVTAKEPAVLATLITAGDDYEILSAVPPAQIADLTSALKSAPTPMRRIGTFVKGAGVAIKAADGASMSFDRKGWDHF